MDGLFKHQAEVNTLLARYGVRFGIYQDKKFIEQLFPFDVIPRTIAHDEFAQLERGLIQRVTALNLFLADMYSDKRIVREGIVPEEFVFSSSGYLPQCDGVLPAQGIYSHISGIDLVQSEDGTWYVLEDNLRIPSGASYPMIARELCRRCSPSTFNHNQLADNRDYAKLLQVTMHQVNRGGLNVILTPGRYNAAYFEHSYLAENTEALLATGNDLIVENDTLYYKEYNGKKRQVGAVYRRISDDYLDPLIFSSDSLIGVPGIFQAYKKGNVALLNAPGNGIADDKGTYYFVPRMIHFYLNEEPILQNAPTYLPFYPQDMRYILAHFDDLVLKDVAEAGGYGVVFGRSMSKERKEAFIQLLKNEPRRFIGQEIIYFRDLDILDNEQRLPRKADLRAFVLTGKTVQVWKSGLTRFSRDQESFIVNSSQGGGFKDTWVYSQAKK
ncbi:MAG: circularly permuted type 2 ATP-grasp protein [Peptococcaceae bacterium]|jgi:uncharacterized circularly permuted ATP-grasp superfamily protein|nr:circularly permuted type 2 ATP-grasp protein [Peptococcaceae bacterium]